MTHKRLPIEAVNNMLASAKAICPELKDFKLSFAPKIQGEKVALMKNHIVNAGNESIFKGLYVQSSKQILKQYNNKKKHHGKFKPSSRDRINLQNKS
jgi:hypothetical protein